MTLSRAASSVMGCDIIGTAGACVIGISPDAWSLLECSGDQKKTSLCAHNMFLVTRAAAAVPGAGWPHEGYTTLPLEKGLMVHAPIRTFI